MCNLSLCPYRLPVHCQKRMSQGLPSSTCVTSIKRSPPLSCVPSPVQPQRSGTVLVASQHDHKGKANTMPVRLLCASPSLPPGVTQCCIQSLLYLLRAVSLCRAQTTHAEVKHSVVASTATGLAEYPRPQEGSDPAEAQAAGDPAWASQGKGSSQKTPDTNVKLNQPLRCGRYGQVRF